MDDPLLAAIVEEIQTHPEKKISFRRYMEQVLYHPCWGYYRRVGLKIGKRGDFYTSPHLGDVFGETLARVISRMVSSFSPGCPWILVEAGGGDGRLAKSILSSLNEEKRLPQSLWLVERSPFHCDLQRERFKDAPVPVHWAESVTEISGESPCILYSNELLDAFPVHRVVRKGGELQEIYVAWDEHCQRLVECSCPPSDPSLAAYFRRLDWNLPEGWTAEVPLDVLAWLEEVGGWMKTGYLITIDYGGTTEELSQPQRKNGTLRCYRNHHLHGDWYSRPGTSDLTFHVNFSALQDHGERVGLNKLVYTTQTRFLQGAGILDRLANTSTDPFSPEARRNRAIRQLALQGGMGDAFRVLIQSKGVEMPVTGLKEGAALPE
ncbi:SAM-dependent methyltransferase [Kroppenstedtia guangzhouensis]|uniref:SAM-dependent methyltransferase n=1 Tax=Kroppenstedtia guangzhouensis TaxID=1274356 RepID=A0ABQ1FW74_9BACL|nr:SAM-dependent methyltransferase [Kroppenstedtia guangzhouensis]GGA32449.1 SAM-dependent methyltransferase [Kroppenstedtia guangzhouensis]